MYDVAIIGSGCSGGVISYYLTKAGIKCVLIEAGKQYSNENFPKGELEYNAELFWNGGLDISTDARLAFLRGKAVGGGSVINQALLDRFDETVLKEWKETSGIDFFTNEAMDKHYKAIENFLRIQTIPENFRNKNAEIFINGFNKLGYKWKSLERGYTDCATEQGNDCIACLGGCHRGSKQSMLVTFIAEAKKFGLEVKADFYVDQLVQEEANLVINGYNNKHLEKSEQIQAKKIVIAGGSLGTTQLLLKSDFKTQLPSLGDRFFCHPQVMNFALFDEPINAHKGMFQSVKSEDPSMQEKGFKVENVFALPIGLALLYPGHGKKHQEWMSKFKYMACIEIAIKDQSEGKLKIDKNGRLKIYKKLSKEEHKIRKEGIRVVNEIFKANGAKEIFNATQLFGLHLMGGCCIGKDPKKYVVNEKFQLHCNKDIYIADSSIFVKAPGINPSLTIMALSHKAVDSIIDDFKGGHS